MLEILQSHDPLKASASLKHNLPTRIIHFNFSCRLISYIDEGAEDQRGETQDAASDDKSRDSFTPAGVPPADVAEENRVPYEQAASTGESVSVEQPALFPHFQ